MHKEAGYSIHFAVRGNSDRTQALRNALVKVRNRFTVRYGIASSTPIDVIASDPRLCVSLQATDYLLWALQRLFERKQDQWVEYLWPCFRRVHDIDDVRFSNAGTYYTKDKAISWELLKKRVPGI